MYRLITSLCLALMLPFMAQAEEEFLKPEQAFIISAGEPEAGKIKIQWQIADGYYLYQNKIRISTDNRQVSFAEPKLPPSITKKDPFFGDIEIYRDQLEIQVPLQSHD